MTTKETGKSSQALRFARGGKWRTAGRVTSSRPVRGLPGSRHRSAERETPPSGRRSTAVNIPTCPTIPLGASCGTTPAPRRWQTHESLALPASGAKALLRTLRADEKVLALYHQGLGHAALTGSALVLLGPGPAPRVTRVPRPLAILRPAHGARRIVDVSVEGRSIGLWGSQLDASGQLLVQAGEPVPDPLAEDARTAQVAAGESISLSDAHKKALLEALERGEVVRALYRDGWGHAALTGNGLVLLRNPWAPKATRVPRPLRILRPTYGLFDAVDLLVDGKPHKLNGSKLDPRGELLQAMGELLPPESPVRPGRGTRIATWIRRHPVLMSAGVALMFFGGTASDTSGDEASAQVRADRTLTVPDFTGASLGSAVSKAEAQAWRTVSAMDASSAFRPLDPTARGWRVCFQLPGHEETVRPSPAC